MSIRHLRLVPDVDAGALRVTVEARGQTSGYEVRLVAYAGDKVISRGVGAVGSEIRLPVENARLWSPVDPFLYGLQVALLRGDRKVDVARSYFGMRKIEVARDKNGKNRITLNGKRVLPMCVLDQGYWPDGLYTAPEDEALQYDIEITKKLGFTMTRKHAKVEPDRWYYWCDRLGLMVWQEMPAAGTLLKLDVSTLYDPKTIDLTWEREPVKQFERELRLMIEGLSNHPSIIAWVVFNSGWGQHDTVQLTDMVRELDPSRLVTCLTGWNLLNRQGGVVDQYHYPGPGGRMHAQSNQLSNAPLFAEFGSLGLHVEAHTWTGETWAKPSVAWGSTLAPSSAELTRRYVCLIGWVWGRWVWGRNKGWSNEPWRDEVGHSTVFYSQLTDVESEVSGLVTYDRGVVKVDLNKVAAANRGEFPPRKEMR